MNKYETVIIISDAITADKRNLVITKVKEFITQNGKITKQKDIGSKKLAYKVKDQYTGYYYELEFEAKAESICEIERLFRITDEILKFIVIRQEN